MAWHGMAWRLLTCDSNKHKHLLYIHPILEEELVTGNRRDMACAAWRRGKERGNRQ